MPSEGFEAKYMGICARGDTIRAGELVRYEGDELVHVNCREDDDPARRHPFQGTSLEHMGY